MPLPSLAAARRLAAALPKRPQDPDLHPLAEELARHAAPKKSPGRSIAKACDHLIRDEPLRRRVRELADAWLKANQTAAAAPPALPVAEWITLEVAAVMYGLRPDWMRRALRHPQYRRMWGWPRCLDGLKDWRFRRAVAAGEAVVIEADEPPHLLPSWCLRAADVDMAATPTVA